MNYDNLFVCVFILQGDGANCVWFPNRYFSSYGKILVFVMFHSNVRQKVSSRYIVFIEEKIYKLSNFNTFLQLKKKKKDKKNKQNKTKTKKPIVRKFFYMYVCISYKYIICLEIII